MRTETREWIIQRCIDADRSTYEDWPPYAERLMTRSEVLEVLATCAARWPERGFRGHNVVHVRPGNDILRSVR
jgi:hypothetical protein